MCPVELHIDDVDAVLPRDETDGVLVWKTKSTLTREPIRRINDTNDKNNGSQGLDSQWEKACILYTFFYISSSIS